MKKLMLVFACLVFMLSACVTANDNGVQQGGGNTLARYYYVKEVTIDPERNIVCWTYDASKSIKPYYVTECLDFIPSK